MRIIGIDPGTNIIGWGVIEKINHKLVPIAYDSIIIKKGPTLAQKLEIIYNSLTETIAKYKPDVGAVEELFFVNNVLKNMR